MRKVIEKERKQIIKSDEGGEITIADLCPKITKIRKKRERIETEKETGMGAPPPHQKKEKREEKGQQEYDERDREMMKRILTNEFRYEGRSRHR